MEVVPGIHKVDGTWGGNVYLLVDEDSLDLVDAALPFNAGKILHYIDHLAETRLSCVTWFSPTLTPTTLGRYRPF